MPSLPSGVPVRSLRPFSRAGKGSWSEPGRRVLLVLATWFLATAMPALAGPPPGAASCSGCHGPAGSGPVPSLAGRPAAEIVAAMQAFRSGGKWGAYAAKYVVRRVGYPGIEPLLARAG